MFDANAAYIKLGRQFFAEVRRSDEELMNLGINAGDVILCSHLSVHPIKPRFTHETQIWTSVDSEPILHVEDPEIVTGGSWLVYAGMPDGRDFIDPVVEEDALEFLGGKWRVNDNNPK